MHRGGSNCQGATSPGGKDGGGMKFVSAEEQMSLA